jgi:hypothetical protein
VIRRIRWYSKGSGSPIEAIRCVERNFVLVVVVFLQIWLLRADLVALAGVVSLAGVVALAGGW